MTVYANPSFLKGPQLETVKRTPVAGWTGQAGQPVRNTDSGLVLCKSNATSMQGLLAETQATATVATTKVKVYDIPSQNTKMIIGVTAAGADTKALSTYLGANFGLAVNSCVATISTGNDSNEILHVDDLLVNIEGHNNDTSDVPGFLVCSVTAAGLTAEGSGA